MLRDCHDVCFGTHMNKGRNAAKAFTDTRAARFADARRATAEKKAAEVAEGTRRGMQMVDVDDVRADDEVCTNSGFRAASEVDRSEWVTSNGQTVVMRFESKGA